MKTLIIAMFMSLSFHLGLLYIPEMIWGKKTTTVSTTVDLDDTDDVVQKEEEIAKPPPPQEVVESDEIIPEELLAATLAEVIPTSVSRSDFVVATRPSPPRPPRPDALGSLDMAALTQGAISSTDSGIDMDSIIDITQLDNRPRPLTQVNPIYPPALQRNGVEGTVVVRFTVNEDGMVLADTIVVVSSTNVQFERPAIDAIRRWRFSQGIKNGRPIKFTMQQPMRFNIDS